MEQKDLDSFIEAFADLTQKQLEEIKRLGSKTDVYAWKSDKEAYGPDGLNVGKTYFDRIRHKLPHISVADEKTGIQSVVYPVAQCKQWMDDHVEYYGR